MTLEISRLAYPFIFDANPFIFEDLGTIEFSNCYYYYHHKTSSLNLFKFEQEIIKKTAIQK